MSEPTAANATPESARGFSRREFIKRVIASGATVSAAAYMYGGLAGCSRKGRTAGGVERLIALNVNGQVRRVDVLPNETLAMTLRYKLGLTGTKLGCDRGECGACTVVIDDIAYNSCSTLTHTVRARKVLTIEGLAGPNGELHPVQKAFVDELAPQCGFCTPGQVMSAVALLKHSPKPTRDQARLAMSGNLCRCGAYDNYLNGVMRAAADAQGGVMAFKHIGKDFIPHDVVAKVTGQAKYAEDFRADGMVFCRLLTSPIPHARVKNIDAAEALKMEGVLGMITADDIPAGPPGFAPSLTKEPMYVGGPILAVAATSEQAAEDAIERIKIDYEPLPFTFDPLESLFPGGKDARTDGFNTGTLAGLPPGNIKWTAADFAKVKPGEELPMGKPAEEWKFGDVDAQFKQCKLVYEERFVTAALAHHSMEPRSCMAYWQNGKCFVHASLQSQSFALPGLAQMLGLKPEEVVLIAEYCGGGFGSKGSAYPSMVIPAYLSKKIGKPVMMRISRAEEYYLGSARNAFQGNIKVGFDASGKLLAADVYVVQDSGAHISFWDYRSVGEALALVYQPKAMRWRGLPVFCNAPTRSAQRGPGQNQLACVMEPLIDRAARDLKLDRVEIRKRNNPVNGSMAGGNEGKRGTVSSAYIREALDKGRTKFKWDERKKRSGQKIGPRVTGIGVGQAFHPAGAAGFDGLVCLRPDGKLHIHTGIGNLGTFSHSGTSRIAAEVLKIDWENCVIERGDSRKHLPWNLGQFGSNTSYTMTRTNYVAAQDALAKLKEIAAQDLGGKPDDYDVDGTRVFAKANASKSLTYADAAKRAIALGGKFDGHELPKDINPMTQASATALAGQGLIGVAKDNLPWTGQPAAFAACFIEIELDTETGMHRIVDLVSVADCGTVIHPMGLATQIKGGAVQGIGMATLERLVFDPQNGLPANVGLHQQKPPSYLDLPTEMFTDAVDKADPSNPVGAKGVGEPLMGASAAALLCAISDAMGGHVFNRTPVLPDMILNQLAGRPQPRKPLSINTQ